MIGALEGVGAACLVMGAALIYWPAAWIVAGVVLIVAALALERGSS